VRPTYVSAVRTAPKYSFPWPRPFWLDAPELRHESGYSGKLVLVGEKFDRDSAAAVEARRMHVIPVQVFKNITELSIF
jgi:hypothetical protein